MSATDVLTEAAKAARDAALGVLLARGIEVAAGIGDELEMISRALLRREVHAQRLVIDDQRTHDTEG